MVYKRRERVVAQDSCQWAYAELTFTPQTEEVSVVVNFNTLSYDYLDYEDDYYETYYGVEQGDLLSSVRARLFERHLCLCPSMCGVDWTTRPPRPLLRQKPLHAVAPRARIAFVHDAPSFVVLVAMAGLLPGRCVRSCDGGHQVGGRMTRRER